MLSGLTLVVALGVAPAIAAAPAAAAAADPPPPTRTITSPGNPIIGDGSLYTADAAPLVGADGRLYLYTGHDEASANQGSFVMRDYNVLATDDPASGEWDVYQGNLKPGEVFDWATGNSAFAGHAVRGPDGRYYWYVPVQWENTAVPNRMAIGVAVADSPVGPWTDALGSPLLDLDRRVRVEHERPGGHRPARVLRRRREDLPLLGIVERRARRRALLDDRADR